MNVISLFFAFIWFIYDTQLLVMETERFSVPELLFHPMDIGLRQVGVADAALQSLSAVESTLAEAAAGLVLSTGGNTNFFNFQERFRTELRAGLPSEYGLQVVMIFNSDMFDII